MTSGSINLPNVAGRQPTEERDQPANSNLRVVILCAGSGSDTPPQLPAQCVRAASGYEAAAEILSAPTAALVVDLRILNRGHIRLLEVARQMDTEVLAVGAVLVAAAAALAVAGTPVVPSGKVH